MAEQEQKPKKLPYTEKTDVSPTNPDKTKENPFEIVWKVSIFTNENPAGYQGTLTIKRLNVRQKAALGVEVARRSSGLANVHVSIDDLIQQMVHTEMTVKTDAPWWKPGAEDFYDTDLLSE